MSASEEPKVHFPLSEKIKGLPGIFGIRLEEEPRFKILVEDGASQVRAYQSTLVAKTVVNGTRREAMERGFEILAAYILGANSAGDRIEMTNPVFEGQNGDNTLSLKAPLESNGYGDEWVVAFCLPREISYNSAPKPTDTRVLIAEMPSRLVASYRFSGSSSEENIEEATAALRTWLDQTIYQAVSEPIFAQYDPPFAIPMLRRNEIQIEVR